MNDALKTAIEERIALGNSRDNIIKELQAAGYTRETATELYEQIAGESTTPTAEPLNIEPTKESGADSASEQSQTPSTPPAPAPPAAPPADQALSKQHTGFPVALVVLVVVVLAVAGVAYGMVASGWSLSSLFGGKPYETEAEMVGGLIRSSQELTAHGFNIDYQLAIEERTADTKKFDTNALPEEVRDGFTDGVAQMLQGGFIPAEVDIRASISGVADIRDEAQPEFDMSVNFNMLAEPLIINAAGSLRMADGVVYGKIDDFPANFEVYLEDIPMDTWLIIATEGDFELPVNPTLPIDSKQVFEHIPAEVLSFVTTELQRVATLPVTAARQSQSFFRDQAAQVGASRFFDATMSNEERQLIERSLALLQQYPPIRFVGEPARITLHGETVYQYELDIDFDNVRTYLTKLISEGEAITGETLNITETDLRAVFGAAEPMFEEFNRLTDIKYAFRADGSVAGLYVGSVFTFDHSDIDRQFRFEMETSTTRQNDSMDITEPDNVHEQTLEEIMEARMEKLFEASGYYEGGYYEDDYFNDYDEGDWYGEGSEEEEMFEIPVIPRNVPTVSNEEVRRSLELVRNQAEIIQAGAGAAGYGGVCEDAQIQRMLLTLSQSYDTPRDIFIDSNSSGTYIMCNDSQSGFSVTAPLIGTDKIWCVDSMGSSRDLDQYSVSYQSVVCGM